MIKFIKGRWTKMDKEMGIVLLSMCIFTVFIKLHPMPIGLRIFLVISMLYWSDLFTGLYNAISKEDRYMIVSLTTIQKIKVLFGLFIKTPELLVTLYKDTRKDISYPKKVKQAYTIMYILKKDAILKKSIEYEKSQYITYSSVASMFRELEYEKSKLNKFIDKIPILDNIRRYMFYKFNDYPSDLHSFIRYNYQRVKYGISNRDCWCLSGFLIRVILRGCRYILKNKQGIPGNMILEKDGLDESGEPTDKAHDKAEVRWNSVLNKIINTFEVAERINMHDWFYQESDKYSLKEANKYRKANKARKVYSKTKHENLHAMSKKECVDYEEGWELFRINFFNLWD